MISDAWLERLVMTFIHFSWPRMLRLVSGLLIFSFVGLSTVPSALPNYPKRNFEKLKQKDPFVRLQGIVDIFQNEAPSPEIACTLVEFILNENNADVRFAAVVFLKPWRSHAKGCASELVDLLTRRGIDFNRRLRAAEILGVIGNEAPESVQALLNLVANRDTPMPLRSSAAEALVNFGRLPVDAVRILQAIAFSGHEPTPLRISALLGLGETGSFAVTAIPDLSQTIGDSSERTEIREAAITAVGTICSEAQAECPVNLFADMMRNESTYPRLRFAISETTGKMAGALGPAANTILRVFRDIAVDQKRPKELRMSALEVLGRAGQSARQFGDDLVKIASSDKSNELRITAAQTLSRVGTDLSKSAQMARLLQRPGLTRELRIAAIATIQPEDNQLAEGTADILVQILNDNGQEPPVRGKAAEVLARLRPLPPRLMQYFQLILQDPKTEIELQREIVRAAGTSGTEAGILVPTLAQILDGSSDVLLRREACFALLAIGKNGNGAVSALERILRAGNPDLELKRTATLALGALGASDRESSPQVIATLLEIVQAPGDPRTRQSALVQLPHMEIENTNVLPVLSKILANPTEDPQMRSSVANAFGNLAQSHKIDSALPSIVGVLNNPQEDHNVRQAIVFSLRGLSEPSEELVDTLIHLAESEPDASLRREAVWSLGIVGNGSEPAATALYKILSNQKESEGLREYAAESLGRTGLPAKPYIHALVDFLKDPLIKATAFRGLTLFGEQSSARGETSSLPDLARAEVIVREDRALVSLSSHEGACLPRLRRVIAEMKAQDAAREGWSSKVRHLVAEHSGWLVVPALFVLWLLWLALCLLMLWFTPRSLLPISDYAAKKDEVKIWNWSLPFGWGVPILVPSLRFHPRSLDAWTKSQAEKFMTNFNALPTVSERKVYVDLPVKIENQLRWDFRPAHLREWFEKGQTLFWVVGEGGSGKTSIACQIAKACATPDSLADHLMLPILIEGDFSKKHSDSEEFVEAVRGRLRYLLDAFDPPSKPMLESLLKNRRVLVIVDGLSEMSEESASSLMPLDPSFSARALVVTARNKKRAPNGPVVQIEPQRLRGSSLSIFVEAYLEKIEQSELLGKQEFLQKVADLQQIVGEREITPLFAKLYVDLFVDKKEHGDEKALPTNVPQLVSEYVGFLNRSTPPQSKKDGFDILGDARTLARLCVMPKLHPAPVKIGDARQVLGGGDIAKEKLAYLEERLRLIQTLEPSEEIRFALDPIAEYLAASRLVEENKDDEGNWREFFERVNSLPGGPKEAQGFLQAILDCYVDRYEDSSDLGVRGQLRRYIEVAASLRPEDSRATDLENK